MPSTRPSCLVAAVAAALALPSAASAAMTFSELPDITHEANGVLRITATGSDVPLTTFWLELDGIPRTQTWGPFVWPRTLTFDTALVPEGEYSWEILSDGPTPERWGTVNVDRTAPGAPVPVTPLEVTTSAASVGLSWALPAGERAASAEGTLCDVTTCQALTAPGVRPMVRVSPPIGVSTVRLWLRDRAGNADPSHATTWTITRTPATASPPPRRPPAPPPARPRVDPKLRIASARASANRRAISVAGTLGVPHTNRVSVSVRARYGTRTRTVRTIATVTGHAFRARVVLPSARWRTATAVARVGGSSRYLTVEKRRAVRLPRR